MNTLSLRGFTKSSMNLDKNSSVSARSSSVKKNNSPSLNDNHTIKNENVFLHTAGQSPLKNTKLLIEVWKEIHKKYPNVKLFFTSEFE